jgi:hypothetical protein
MDLARSDTVGRVWGATVDKMHRQCAEELAKHYPGMVQGPS